MKYEIKVQELNFYVVEVEATTEEDACELALDWGLS